MSVFARIIGIDYSGAQTPTASLPGLRVYASDSGAEAKEILPPPSPRKYWTRKGVAAWLVGRLAEDVPTLVGIDHAFSFPLSYFETHGVSLDWPAFLDDFHQHWPTDGDQTYVDFVRAGIVGNRFARTGNTRWRRLTEHWAGGAKSVFHFDVQGSVAKSTHAGIPWLRFVRRQLGARIHFWPFDGWEIPSARSVIAEVYPALWSKEFPRKDRTGDQHDAYSIAAWLARADRDGQLRTLFSPALKEDERAQANIEGWILGVMEQKQRSRQQPRSDRTKPTPAAGPTVIRPHVSRSYRKSLVIGGANKNRQLLRRATSLPGNDHLQRVYVLQCGPCGLTYGANGSDVWQRKCPACQGGRPGLDYEE